MRKLTGIVLLLPLLARAQSPFDGTWKMDLTNAIGQATAAVTGCPSKANAAGASMCGTVAQPLDRSNPGAGSINIYFEVYPHTNKGPATSAILADIGGPGVGTTFMRSMWLSVFAANRDAHDVLLIDNRGTGQSQAINCSSLQHGTGASQDQEIADCATQLGSNDVSYSAGDVALDMEAVRAALGYNLVDIYGGSYGGLDAIAYATRFGSHVRSLVLDSPVGPMAESGVTLIRSQANSAPNAKSLQCERSPSCSPDHPNAAQDLQALINAVRQNPLFGQAYNQNGQLVNVMVNEAVLEFVTFIDISGAYVQQGELLAAGSALADGDSSPLLRIGAEFNGGVLYTYDFGDPTTDSNGDLYAAQCADLTNPYFNWKSSPSQRMAQFTEAMSQLPSNYFAPFSTTASTDDIIGVPRQCVYWERQRAPLPSVPRGASYPAVPTVVFGSDIDLQVPAGLNLQVAALFPNSTFLSIADAKHEPVLSDGCANTIATNLIDTLSPGDTSCTATPYRVWQTLGRFPRFAADAVPAIATLGNAAGNQELRVATVAVSAATDVVKRTFFGGGSGVCLRGGTFSTTFSANSEKVRLNNCSFSEDVQVSGSITYGFPSFSANLTVSGAGTGGGSLGVQGAFEGPGPVGNFEVTGTLGGAAVAAVVPES